MNNGSQECSDEQIFDLSLTYIHNNLYNAYDHDITKSVNMCLDNIKNVYESLRKKYDELSESMSHKIEEAQEHGRFLERSKNPSNGFILRKFDLDNNFDMTDINTLKF